MDNKNIYTENPVIAGLINQLPSGWHDFKAGDYLRCLQHIKYYEAEPDDPTPAIHILSVLLAIPFDQLYERTAPAVIQAMIARISFMSQEPKGRAVDQWFKDVHNVNDINYRDFTALQSLMKDPVNNMLKIITAFNATPITEDEVNNLSVEEVHNRFFTLLKYSKKLLRSSTQHLAKTIVKQQLRSLKESIRLPRIRRNSKALPKK